MNDYCLGKRVQSIKPNSKLPSSKGQAMRIRDPLASIPLK